MTVSAYPLCWPPNFPRSKKTEKGAFKTTLAGAISNVQDSLTRFAKDSGQKIDQIVMSSNVTLGASRPADSGVAVWFVWDGTSRCIAVDRYQTVEANLQAIHHIIEARRVELRHGTLALVRATFSGFAALPPPEAGKRQAWFEVLGVPRDADKAMVDEAYRKLAQIHHPDKNPNDPSAADRMAAINEARDEFNYKQR